ncbi:unnamed protein product (macronuclear) [Paramecium tetraurelia]|uniref:Uncharacterized protein n=1 Tax=Paramecium tetraurelia TaxID=5888 RepID=A0D157_PARTE|nr:uncharacterized protein GSPATT00012298001 [Paramecium tetraurelia]CAK76774.1 unnamed protein product [Paramecium tetraurelia]|eukprot:XP_001444171.1 hypothetical protein (macronuclear) [Paramecium tetraurelia strain d4-2]
MDQFSLETKIREVVYELSQPTMMRCNIPYIYIVSDCIRQIDQQQLSIDYLKQQIRQQNENQQNHQIETNRRYSEIDALQKQQKKLEQEIMKNLTEAQQSSANFKSRVEKMEMELEQQKSNYQVTMNSQYKTQSDLDQLAKKQAEYSVAFNNKIEDFMKDYYTYFVENRNQVHDISKEQQQTSKYVQSQYKQLEQLEIYKNLSEQSQSSLADRVEWIIKEMNHLVNQEYFKFTFDKEEKSRMEDNQFLKGAVQLLQSQVQVYNISFDERVKGLEMFEIQYRQQLNSFQQQMNSQTENYQKFFKETSQQLQSQNTALNVIQDFQKNSEEKISLIVNNQIGVFQTNLNNQMKKLTDQFNGLKVTIAKEMTQEFNYKLEDIRQQLLNESLKQLNIRLATFELQIQELKNKQYQKDAEVQVILSDNSLSQQEQLQNFIIEQIDMKMTSSSSFKGQKVVRRNSICLNAKGGFNLIQAGHADIQKSLVLSEQLSEQLEDMKTDIQMLFEMREEMEQKFKVFEADFSVAIQNFDRNHSHVLKLKSDIFNDTEYLNSQIKILFREKDIINRKFSLLLQLFSGGSEVAQITVAYLLKQLKDPIKFTSDLGMVFEFRNEICSYRQSNYTIEDLLKKSFQSFIDSWDKSELLEVREFNPHWYFNKYIYKNHASLSKTLDRSFEKTIKCTTQTVVDGEEFVRRSGRQRNTSQKQSIMMSMDSTRQKKVTVRSMYKQQERDDSNECFPKVKK